jgi:cytochrome c2
MVGVMALARIHLPLGLLVRSLAVLAAGGLVAGALTACGPTEASAPNPYGGDTRQGALLIRERGCGSCHEVPGVQGAQGTVGPPLQRIARRVYLAGMLRNTPENMIFWLRNPQAVVPGNAMPDMNLSEQEARHIGAYLATLN